MVEITVAFSIIAVALLPVFTMLRSTTSKINRGIYHFQSQHLINELFQQLTNLNQQPGFESIVPQNRDLKSVLEGINNELSNKGIRQPKKILLSSAKDFGILVSPLPENFVSRQLFVKQVFDSSTGTLDQNWYKVTIRVVWAEQTADEVTRESYLFLTMRP